ncbi:hypothetical protein ATCC90586_012116 [Pythium insidiosum]|nr:hypothetical protein ATCC90586_012116 [Pythium insidiosum]
MMAFALVALVLGVSSAHAASLHHQATRLLRDVTESSSIHLTLTPRVDSTLALSGVTVDGVLFPRPALDGSLHFDGRLSYDHADARHNLTLLNDRGSAFSFIASGTMTDAFPEYFGSVQHQIKCCARVQFLHVDTLNTPWYDASVTSKLCDAAQQLSGSADRMAIENVAIIAHSMGNLITAAALLDQCGLAASSKWIALAGPMRGSASASSAMTAFSKLPSAVVECLCIDNQTPLDDPLLHALTFFGLCPTRRSLQSIVLQGSRASSSALDARLERAVESFGRHVTSSLCAVSSAGLVSKDSAMLAVLGVGSGQASRQNDGQVEFAACRGPLDAALYSASWRDGRFYKPQINHLDATLRLGDGWWGDDRKPLKWHHWQI